MKEDVLPRVGTKHETASSSKILARKWFVSPGRCSLVFLSVSRLGNQCGVPTCIPEGR